MKKIILIPIIIVSGYIQAQVAIGKENVANTSVSLDFASTENRGLILPYVEDKSTIATEGTIIYDVTDHKVKYLKNGATWVNLSEDDGTAATIGAANISIQQGPDKIEQTSAKVAIGLNADADNTPGLLVLSDTNKAMVLPQVASPHLNIISPSAGMIVYDTVKRQVAVFNGTVWSFWKP